MQTQTFLLNLFVQQGIELRPNLIFLCAGDMAKSAFRLRFQFGSWSFWLVMIEIVVPPPAGIGIALGILDGHIGTIPRPGKYPRPEGSVREPSGYSPGSVSCSSLNRIVPSGNVYVFL
jgi:hypothetical protein